MKLEDSFMMKDTIDHEFTTAAYFAEVARLLVAFPSNAVAEQSLIASHGWFME
jgi:hypothetical protein